MARAIWKGTLGFGLVSIGVELHSAESAERLDLDLLDRRDMSRIGYQKINKTTGKEVGAADIVRGYQVSKGRYVILEDQDLEAANPRATRTIDILGFVDAGAIPLLYYAKPYLVGPLEGNEKAYLLFRDALEESAKVALAQLVIHTRQYRAAVFPHDGMIAVQLLRYHDDLKSRADVGMATLPTPGRALRAEERKMAKELIASMATEWDPEQYHDEYRDDLLALVKRRAKEGSGREVREEEPEPEDRSDTKVIDLVAALKQSLEEGRVAAAPKPSRTKPARKRVRKSA
jgi:DNA end-binding protein Ku